MVILAFLRVHLPAVYQLETWAEAYLVRIEDDVETKALLTQA